MMKLNKNSKKLLGMVAVALVVLYLLNYRLVTPANNSGGDGGASDQWTVYGSMKCGWTRKQLDHMKSKQIPHVFVDCDKEDCGNISAFPTLDDPNGKRTTGFSSI
jgi:hypothetical protein